MRVLSTSSSSSSSYTFQAGVLPGCGHVVMAYLPTTLEATALRATCKSARETVAAFPWRDPMTPITGKLASWHACFPKALAGNVRSRRDLTNADFHLYFRRLQMLSCAGCDQASLTEVAFEHMPHLEWLDLRGCNQDGFTSRLLRLLPKLTTLHLEYEGELRQLGASARRRSIKVEYGVGACTECGVYPMAKDYPVGRLCRNWCSTSNGNGSVRRGGQAGAREALCGDCAWLRCFDCVQHSIYDLDVRSPFLCGELALRKISYWIVDGRAAAGQEAF